MARRTLQERFDSHWTPEPNTGCWLWTGALSHGYGSFQLGTTSGPREAQRVALELAGVAMPSGCVVYNACGLHSCVNPWHWLVGEMSDALAQASLRGRLRPRRGSLSTNAKLSASQVAALRSLVADGTLTQALAADLLGVKAATVSQIIRRATWPDEDSPSPKRRRPQSEPSRGPQKLLAAMAAAAERAGAPPREAWRRAAQAWLMLEGPPRRDASPPPPDGV